MNREVLLELKRERKLHDLWKQGQASQEGYRTVLGIHRQKTQKLRAETGLFVSGNKKGGFVYVNSKSRSKENIGLRLVEGGHLTNRRKKPAEIFNAFFASVLNDTDWATWCLEAEDHKCGDSDLPFLDTDTVIDQLDQLHVHSPWQLRALAPQY